MTAIFGDVRRDRGQLRHLMTARDADRLAGAEPVRARSTGIRGQIDEPFNALGWHQRAMVARMPRLPAGLASTLPASLARPLLASEAVGRRRLGREGGILLPERELAFEIRDAFRLLGQLLAEPLVVAPQALDFRGMIGRRARRVVRRSRRTAGRALRHAAVMPDRPISEKHNNLITSICCAYAPGTRL